ncbi:DNA-binding response regulator [Actinoplanes ianthinogenes]|uniref:DNA-binding response regulator n=1 Tax=Actinoplanes ianthinogenes TaxID=122358 RepID=A0ABM7LMA6_9ACTN|nr:response regulator transcription factor [Actinoplanes ianthinogenes]BCJ40396.1 DNA-binding response regulator [Actinoplanes ianthinogenes]GGR11952.1 DNA-binding response regulator [Actinoplanes ianthinogenes]
MTSVLIVDDDELIRAGLRAILAGAGITVAGEVEDGSEVVQAALRLRPDVILMDVRMPRLDGIQATRLLLAKYPADAPKVLVVTTFANDEYVYEALQAGASGFLLKRARPEQIVEAVRVVARGDSLLFPAAIKNLAAAYAKPDGHLDGAGLTAREAEVLALMADGLSNAEIAERLVLGVETIKTHVGNVLGKLGVRDRTQAVVVAYKSGFISP